MNFPVFGIPTVWRPVENYLILTMKSLLSNLEAADLIHVKFVILVAETNVTNADTIIQEVWSNVIINTLMLLNYYKPC